MIQNHCDLDAVSNHEGTAGMHTLVQGQEITGIVPFDDREQKTEDRGQKTEDRGQKAEDRGRRAEDRWQKTED